MEPGAEPSDVVHFELPKFVEVGELLARLGTHCPVAAAVDGNVWLVTAAVGDGHELAIVLREVERYIADTELLAIRFCVDDRYYVMHNPPVARSEAA
jgi:hypothetical protein